MSAMYDIRRHRWIGQCVHGDRCTHCDAIGYCEREEQERHAQDYGVSGADPGSPQEKPDPLDRIEDAARKQGAWGLERAEVLALVEIARAARDLGPILQGERLRAALARLDN